MPESFIASAPFAIDSERQSFSRAGACFNNGDFAEAERLWEQQRAKYPHEAMLHFVLGRCMQMQRSYDKALACYQTALELDPGFHPAAFYTGSVLLERAEYLKAIEVFSDILQHHPEDVDTWMLLGEALEKMGDTDAASECRHQALQLNLIDRGVMSSSGASAGLPITCR